MHLLWSAVGGVVATDLASDDTERDNGECELRAVAYEDPTDLGSVL